MNLIAFTFNPFSENTYVLSDLNGQCVIIDPGMHEPEEDAILFEYIAEENLTPVMVINTHCHIDHILGNAAACKKYNIPLVAHRLEMPMLERAPAASLMWGVNYTESPKPQRLVEEGDKITFGSISLDILFVPGHSPGHIALVHHEEKVVIGGDVLFRGSVGRVDLPMSNPDDLVRSIREKFYTLPHDYVVYPGHGPETTIGWEKVNNTFVRPGFDDL